MTVAELAAQCKAARDSGLWVFILMVPRKKRSYNSRARLAYGLDAQVIGGNSVGEYVKVMCEDAERFCRRKGRDPSQKIAARLVTGPEKISPSLRQQLGIPDPPADLWAGELP